MRNVIAKQEKIISIIAIAFKPLFRVLIKTTCLKTLLIIDNEAKSIEMKPHINVNNRKCNIAYFFGAFFKCVTVFCG